MVARAPVREEQVVQMILDGASEAEVARHFGVSVRTVKRRIRDFRNQMAAGNKMQALALGVAKGLLTVEVAGRRIRHQCQPNPAGDG